MNTLKISNFLGGYNSVNDPTQVPITQSPFINNCEHNNALASNFKNALRHRDFFRKFSNDVAHTLSFDAINIFKCISGGNAGKTFSITGGLDNVTARWYYTDLAGVVPLTHTELFNTASNLDYHPWCVLYLQYIYMGDGYITNRKWDGNTLTDIGASHPKCKVASTHKSRLLLANDLTNTKPNRLWLTDVGTDTIPSTQFIDVGPTSEGITALHDGIDKIIVVKEFSTWFVYLAPNLIDSTIICADSDNGIPTFDATTSYKTGFICCSQVRGLEVFINQYEPLDNSVKELRQAFYPTVFYLNDFVYITDSGYAQPEGSTLYIYNMKTKSIIPHQGDLGPGFSKLALFRNTTLEESFLMITWYDSFTDRPSLSLLHSSTIGTARENDKIITYTFPDLTFDLPANVKALNSLVLYCLGNLTTVQVFIYCDESEVAAYTGSLPTLNGLYSVLNFNLDPGVIFGKTIKIALSVDTTSHSFELYEGSINYDILPAVLQ